MKSFLKHLSLISLGIFISTVMMSVFPTRIKAVTASLSSTRIEALEDPSMLINDYAPSLSRKTGSIPFALPWVNIHNNGHPLQQDINGDGLLDIVYSFVTGGRTSTNAGANQYVLLNNGQGYDTVYLCRYNSSQSYTGTVTIEYRGDCANYN